MNKFIGIGRVCKDFTISGSGDKIAARSSMAFERRYKSNGQPDADFLNVVAFGKTAEMIQKYVSKGVKIGVEGRINTGSYTNKEGQKVYTFDVVIEAFDFCESKNASSGNAPASESSGDGFVNVPQGVDEELPFN